MKDFENVKIGGSNESPFILNLKYLNRHVFIGGSTGSGKTTTAKKIIEVLQLNDINTIIFDAKGDLSSILNHYNGHLIDYYGLYGSKDFIELNSLKSEELSNILELSKAQEDSFSICLLYAQDNKLQIKTLKQLENVLKIIISLLEQKQDFSNYGYISITSVKTLLRKIKIFELEGNSAVFGASGLSFKDMSANSLTVINSQRLTQTPKLYASIVNKALNELYNELAEVGDLDKVKTVILIDEAHLLFNNAPKKVLKELEQVIKLIRSKSVGIVFISQLANDIPDNVFSQLSTKIQHHINLHTEKDFKNLKALSKAFGEFEKVKETSKIIQNLKTGEVITSQRFKNEIIRDTYMIDLPQIITSNSIEETKLNEYTRNNAIYKPLEEDYKIDTPKPRSANDVLQGLKILLTTIAIITIITMILDR